MWETWGGGAGWLGGFREGGIVEEEEEAWAVVLLGLCLLLGLLGGCLHLLDKADEQGQNAATGVHFSCGQEPLCFFWRLPTSLVLASPFSEWFSSFASASAFSFAFLVFLSSFLSFTAFSFCRGDRTGRQQEAEHSHTTCVLWSVMQARLLPLLPSWPLVPAWAELVSAKTAGKGSSNHYIQVQHYFLC